MPIIDFHAHAFPDSLAPKAIASLEEGTPWEAKSDGTVSNLLKIMDETGVSQTVVSSIATKPGQAASILDWSLRIRSERIIPFASVHPFSPSALGELDAIARADLKGIKLHALYQQFAVDDPRVFPLYEALREAGLVLLMHSGYDIAFDREGLATPERFTVILDRFPGLKMVMSHMGGWLASDNFLEHVAGRDVYIDTSFSAATCKEAHRDAILERHNPDRVLFGTDSPWGDTAGHIDFVNAFPVSDERKEKIFHQNARTLLGLDRGGLQPS